MSFDRFGSSAKEVLKKSYSAAKQFRSAEVRSDHLLYALTLEVASIPAAALAFMNCNASAVKRELERDLLASASKDIATGVFEAADLEPHEIPFGLQTRVILRRAGELRAFFGHAKVEPEHLLLAMLGLGDETVFKLMEELGVNTTFLVRLVTSHVAKRDALVAETRGLKKIIVDGISELVAERVSAIEDFKRLEVITKTRIPCAEKAQIAHIVFTAYMADFLSVQIAYQRYLLEETLELLRARAGTLDSEAAAAIVSSAAQTTRQDVRATIEYVWSNELRSVARIPDEADYDLLGSIIEDIWWTHSEEIALNEGFDEAQDDHRRKHMLSLQRRRLEISERFSKIEARLIDAINDCFLKRSPA